MGYSDEWLDHSGYKAGKMGGTPGMSRMTSARELEGFLEVK